MASIPRIAKRVTDYLRARHWPSPHPAVVQSLIEKLFYASLKTEEGRSVSCTVVFVGSQISPRIPAHDPDRRLHRYIYVPLATPILLTPRSLAKFSQAAPPWASCIAVHERDEELQICGLFDQEIHHQSALNREGEPLFPRPGLFQIEISSIGVLTIYDGRKLLAKLSHETVVTSFHDVLNEGPIASCLLKYIDRLEQRVSKELKPIFPRHDVTSLLVDAPTLWLQALSRILLGIRRLNHGGALLLIPSKPTKDLSINFPIAYDKTETVIERMLNASARWQVARARMRNEFSDPDGLIPAALVQQMRGASNEREDAKKAMLGCTTFISSLAGVDGLILLSGGLRVAGFGVEIKVRKDPVAAWRAGNVTGSASHLKAVKPNEFGGTRHRSMMRYCDRHPGSIGFIISQDGDIRATFKMDRGLVVWNNIQLQEVELESQQSDKSQPRRILQRRDEIEEQLHRSVYFNEIQKTGGIEREIWLTGSGDPLKVSVEKENSDGSSEHQVIYFDQRGSILLVQTQNERPLKDGGATVEETSHYFYSWQLIRVTRKTARFERGKKINMTGVKEKLKELPPLGGYDTGALQQFMQKSDDAMNRLLRGKHHIPPRSSLQKGDGRRFRFIQATTSADGRLAIGLGLARDKVNWGDLEDTCDETTGRQYYYIESPDAETLIRNYVIDVSKNRILGETNCHYPGTRTHYGHRTCQAIWSPNKRFVIQLYQGKWGTIEATAGCIDVSGLLTLDLIKPVIDYAHRFLSRKKERALRRYGAKKFSEGFYCNEIRNSGLVRFELFGEIPKSAEDDSSFSVVGRLQIITRKAGISLKFLGCELGPR